jgi:hypothetical protein
MIILINNSIYIYQSPLSGDVLKEAGCWLAFEWVATTAAVLHATTTAD